MSPWEGGRPADVGKRGEGGERRKSFGVGGGSDAVLPTPPYTQHNMEGREPIAPPSSLPLQHIGDGLVKTIQCSLVEP